MLQNVKMVTGVNGARTSVGSVKLKDPLSQDHVTKLLAIVTMVAHPDTPKQLVVFKV